MPTGKQIKCARVLMGQSAEQFARRVGIDAKALGAYERGERQPRHDTLEKLTRTFDHAGIEFTSGEGVRRRNADVEVFEGREAFNRFTDYVYSHLAEHGGEVCVSVTDEREFAKYRNNLELHRARMKELVDSGRVHGRILAARGNFVETWAPIRRIPENEAAGLVSFYAFGNCLALISFTHDPPPYVALHHSASFAESFRQAFNLAWQRAKPL